MRALSVVLLVTTVAAKDTSVCEVGILMLHFDNRDHRRSTIQ